jgi:hypothetical protein
MNEQVKVIATAFALCGFAVAVTCGLLADNSAHVVVLRALLAMILCQFVGTAAGHCIMYAIDEHVNTYIQNRPVPSINPETFVAEPVSVTSASAPAVATSIQ